MITCCTGDLPGTGLDMRHKIPSIMASLEKSSQRRRVVRDKLRNRERRGQLPLATQVRTSCMSGSFFWANLTSQPKSAKTEHERLMSD